MGVLSTGHTAIGYADDTMGTVANWSICMGCTVIIVAAFNTGIVMAFWRFRCSAVTFFGALDTVKGRSVTFRITIGCFA